MVDLGSSNYSRFFCVEKQTTSSLRVSLGGDRKLLPVFENFPTVSRVLEGFIIFRGVAC